MREADMGWGIAMCLASLAGVAVGQGQGTRAARLFGAAEALHEKVGFGPATAHEIEIKRNVAALRTLLEKSALTAAWAEGRAMARERAVAYALEEAPYA